MYDEPEPFGVDNPVADRPGTRQGDPAGSRTSIHPILVGPTDYHDQRKGWIAWRLAVDL
jgi:hypothetical protein